MHSGQVLRSTAARPRGFKVPLGTIYPPAEVSSPLIKRHFPVYVLFLLRVAQRAPDLSLYSVSFKNPLTTNAVAVTYRQLPRFNGKNFGSK